MSEGIKEMKEAAIGILALGALAVELGKDGYDASDLGAAAARLATDSKLQATLGAAISGIEKVPAEMKDMTWAEGAELAVALIPELMRLIENMSKKA